MMQLKLQNCKLYKLSVAILMLSQLMGLRPVYDA